MDSIKESIIATWLPGASLCVRRGVNGTTQVVLRVPISQNAENAFHFSLNDWRAFVLEVDGLIATEVGGNTETTQDTNCG
jgi:hypothetical protein